MEFANQDDFVDPELYIADQYSRLNLYVEARWRVYEYAIDYIDFYYEALSRFKNHGANHVADIGAGNTRRLTEAISEVGLAGVPVAIDLFAEPYSSFRWSSSQTGKNVGDLVHFVQGRAEQIPLANSSVDGASELFTTYHSDDPKQSIRELKRIATPGGLVVISTNFEDNKSRHVEFEAAAMDILNSIALDKNDPIPDPPIHASSFFANRAEAVISDELEIIERVEQNCEIQLPADALPYYKLSIQSKFPESLTRRRVVSGSEIVAAVETAVDAEYMSEVHSTERKNPLTGITTPGYFTDYAHRIMYVCLNTK